ncbi:MAG: zinc ribbon domain-containing protein [Spirochaetales bacterium]|nr:zinc ribbon domain-containing protein [Spirochaetales bacterium]
MPVFEYVCRACGTPFEKLVPAAGRDVSCPACAGGDVEKKLSVFAVSKSAAAETPACGSTGCGFERGGCGSGMCGHGHG